MSKIVAPPSCLGALLLLSLFVAGCSSGEKPTDAVNTAAVEQSEAGRGDWMVRWLLADPESLNPITSNDSASSRVLADVFSTLMGLDPETLKLRPVLATGPPEVSEDHLSYTFEIRDDVTFSDGHALDVEDVLFSLKAAKIPAVRAPHLRNYLQSLIAVEAVGERKVRFRCGEAYFRNDLVLGTVTVLPSHFYDPNSELAGISVEELNDWEALDPEKKQRAERFADQFNKDYHRKTLGSGAYVIDQVVTGERIRLRHRENFWAAGDTTRGDGWVDQILYRVINNPDAALVSLKAGDLDIMGLTPIQHFKQTGTPGFEKRFAKELAYSPGYSYIGWNQRKPVFRDQKLRQALAHFVDRERLIDKVLLGLGEKVDSPIYKFRPEYDAALQGYAFDPKRGRALLEEAGWVDDDGDGVREKTIDGVKTPLRFEIISNSGNQIRKSVGLVVVDELRRQGVDASFRELDWSIMLGRIKEFDYDAVILGWAMSATPPDLYQVWHSSQAVAGGSNHVSFRSAEADEILENYRGEFDAAKRTQLYQRLQQILHDEAPYAFLFMQKSVSTYDRRFRDTKWYPTGTPDLNEWWVPTALQRYGR